MGVRGLTTFIKNQEKKYLKDFKLHNCMVLLDGNSVASNLFIWSHSESAFGGDYDLYAKYAKEFFKALHSCDVKALVIFDGGYEQRKLKTVYSRMRDKFKSSTCAQPFSGSVNFPLFMRIVFREVLTELKIPFAQSDFEADDELAALARQLKCPVLSYDSDFYIYDVLYIPLPSLCLEPIAFEDLGESDSGMKKYYLDCKIYNVDVFIESFGGLDKSMLPLLATLLGNDYIKRSVFKTFYSNLKIPKGKSNFLQRRIKAVIEWLRNENFESAIKKILGRMKKTSRRRVMSQLKKIINGYVKCKSDLGKYLEISEHLRSSEGRSSNVDTTIVDIINQVENSLNDEGKVESLSLEDLSPVGNETESYDEASSENSDNENGLEESTRENIQIECDSDQVNFPDWLVDYARRGKIQSCVIDILSLKQYFFPPHVEDFSEQSSHFISLKILNALVGLLLGKNNSVVRYWTRNGSHLVCYTVEPIYETASLTFPPCDKLLEVKESLRTVIILEIAELSVDLNALPSEWHLFVIAIIFWLKNMKQPKATESHLHTLVMCLVAIYTIDLKIGVYRNKQSFSRKYKNFKNKLIESRNEERKILKESSQDLPKSTLIDPKTELANVSSSDCVLIFEELLPYHHLSETVKAKPKTFQISTVHAFAQFQSCLFHFIVLNSVLGFPLKEIFVSHLYSGTFAYNIFSNFSKRNNITTYVETLFKASPSLLNLYKSLINFIEQQLLNVNVQRTKSKKKKKKKPDQKSTLEIDISSSKVEDDEIFIDENNKFSMLSLNL